MFLSFLDENDIVILQALLIIYNFLEDIYSKSYPFEVWINHIYLLFINFQATNWMFL